MENDTLKQMIEGLVINPDEVGVMALRDLLMEMEAPDTLCDKIIQGIKYTSTSRSIKRYWEMKNNPDKYKTEEDVEKLNGPHFLLPYENTILDSVFGINKVTKNITISFYDDSIGME